MDRLTDSAQGYCEMYCENYGIPGCDPETCARKGEVAMYERLKDVEGIVPFDRLVKLAFADRAGKCLIVPDPEEGRELDLLEPMKIGRALQSELRKLEYRKSNDPIAISPLDYTIIKCLQAALKKEACECRKP